MRTTQLCDFEKDVSDINNNLSHTIFVFNQFKLDNKDRNKNYSEKLTTEIFTENEYSNQFNVKLKNIEEQTEQTLEYLLDTLFVFTNTQFEVYLKDLYLFIRENFDSSLPEPPEMKIYETVLKLLNVNFEDDLNNLFVSTFDYFKYRRNAIMHRHKTKRFHGAMEDLIKGSKEIKKKGLFRENQLNGQQLDLQWKQYSKKLTTEGLKGYSIKYFKFSNRDISYFNINDLFDVFNFYRLYASTIDTVVLNKINRADLVDYCYEKYKEFYGNEKVKTYEKFSSRFKRTSILSLNLILEETEINNKYSGM